jgi:poly-gamma-glutamate capsule biosynthesis protein CapA/YwtB (metallophosphatase superfamily)
MLRRPRPFFPRVPGSAGAALFALLAVVVVAAGCGPASGAPDGESAVVTTRTSSALASPTPRPPTATPSVAYVPLVPIVAFWSGQRSIDRADLRSILAGQPRPGGPAFGALAVSAADAAGLARALDVQLAPAVRLLDPAAVVSAVRREPATLGIVRAEDVGPQVRALAVDGFSLFGSGRMKDPWAWPLSVRSATSSAFDPAGFWTLTAGGDVNLDRGIYVQAVKLGKGPDFPWNGGTARIAGYRCCGFGGNSLVVGRRTGDPGAFRALLSGSDLSLVNLEGMATRNFVYRTDGFVFSVDPDLLVGLKNAGVDAVSMANNHTRDAGDGAIAETSARLDSLGIAHAGAGPNLAAAMQPAWLSAGGLRIAFLAFDALEPANWARTSRPGAAPLDLDVATAAIRAARQAGADFVIVMPHWGSEYTYYVSPEMRRQAAAMVAAGADLILGSHSHYAGGMQTFAGPSGDPSLTFYSLGNLLFDFNHDERTLEGVVVDLTFDGSRLVQLDLQPTVMVDHSQPNLLDPAGDGGRVLKNIRAATGSYLGW